MGDRLTPEEIQKALGIIERAVEGATSVRQDNYRRAQIEVQRGEMTDEELRDYAEDDANGKLALRVWTALKLRVGEL